MPVPPARPAGGLLAYLLGGLFGLALALGLLPGGFLFPVAGSAWAPQGDAAQHAIVQGYFIRDLWRWPPLLAGNLMPPGGLNIAFADGIPLLALPLKLLARWLPAGFHGIGLWYGIAFICQPLAAIWCLRGAGERRLLPALAAAVAAASMPAFLNRYGHAALMGHFTLLLALGSYLRLVANPAPARWPPGGWAAAAVLAVATLLVHPYLAAMSLALLAAAPLTLLLRGSPAWRGAALGCGGVLLAVGATMALFGYLGAAGDGGYGRYALNLLSPVWPFHSALLPGLVTREVDATGHGGWEGYNWLGAGLLAGLALLLATQPREVARLLRRHAGLALALLGLTLLAVSFRVGLGGRIVLDLGPVPGFLEQFRASGRFFWPVGLSLLMGCIVLLARHPRRRFGLAAVVALALLQFVDAAPLRQAMQTWASTRQPWHLDAAALRPLLHQARSLTLLPTWPCVPAGDPAGEHGLQLEVLALAAETAVPANTMYVARWRQPPVCGDAATLASPPRPGELRLALPSMVAALAQSQPAAPATCARLGALLACLAPPD